MSEIIDRIDQYIEQNRMLDDCDHVVVGLSGGADSVCLLMVIKEYISRHNMNIIINAVHVNHGIRQEAGEDEEFARALCERRKIQFTAVHIDAVKAARELGMSVEEAGRYERYRIFNEICTDSKSRIAVAHHMNDQAETVIMNMSRGASLKGLGGIRAVRDNVIRPLLCITRHEVEQLIQEFGESYVTDATNLSNDYTRNCIRNVLIPYIENNVNSNAVKNFANAADELQKNYDFIEEEADKAYEKYVSENNKDCIRIRNLENGFAQLHEVLRKRVIYRIILKLTGTARDIYRIHVNGVDALALNSVGSRVDICYGLQAERGYNEIILQHRTDNEHIPLCEGFSFDNLKPGETITLDRKLYMHVTGKNENVTITLTLYSNYEKNRNYVNSCYAKSFDYDKIQGKLCLRHRLEGDRIIINESGKSRKLKKEFIDRKVPENMRNNVLLLCDDESVLWALGIRRAENALIDDSTKNVLEVIINISDNQDKGEKL